MPVERLRMRPWLENIINTCTYPGVEWLDEEKKIFRLPWKHASRNGWKMQTDASLFRAWAEHTGKYKEKEKPNPKIWKANFRCALNSLPDMEELMERRSTKGSNAFKVYRIVNKTTNADIKKPAKKYKGRYQRKKKTLSRSTSVKNELKPKSNDDDTQMTGEVEEEILESVEVTTGIPFCVPQPYYRQHLVDHDYAVTRYFDLFDEARTEDITEVFDAPESTVIKTEPASPSRRDVEDHSFYEDENGNTSKNYHHDSSNEADDKVMSDDEVVELIDEMSSECDSSTGSVESTMDDFIDSCMDTLQNDFERPAKQRANSAPAALDANFDSLTVFPTTITAKSKSIPDFKTMLSTSSQELLQSCLS